MILTIKGADFSAANIGTLNTVSIRKSIGSGVTHSIPSFIEKGASVTWTLTLLEDYEFNTYSVTMGDTTITPTVSDGVMTISIANVTAAISINVATTYVGVVEPDEPVVPPVEPEEPVSNIVPFSILGYLSDGEIVMADRVNNPNGSFNGTTDYVDLTNVSKLGFFGRSGTIANVLEFYDSNKNIISSLTVKGTGSVEVINIDLESEATKYANAKYVRASVSKSANSVNYYDKWYFVINEFAEATNFYPTVDVFNIAEYPDTSGNMVPVTDTEMYNGVNVPKAGRTDYISLEGMTELAYWGRMGTVGCALCFYDENKNFISSLKVVGTGKTDNLQILFIDLTESKYANAKYVIGSISRGSMKNDLFAGSGIKAFEIW